MKIVFSVCQAAHVYVMGNNYSVGLCTRCADRKFVTA